MSVPLMAEFQEFASPVVPDRADQPVSETTERFLRAIVERIPIERIEELHLFSPLRQGTVETGIAVVAGVVLVPDVPVVEPEPSEPLELSLAEEAGDESGDTVADVDDATTETESVVTSQEDDDPYAAEPPYTDAVAAIDFAPAQDVEIADDEKPITPHVNDQIERHTVYTARYRLVIKGPDRGRWEADLVEEADAPLITVETVVRGVQRRAGEDTEIVRYNAAQIARALRIPQG